MSFQTSQYELQGGDVFIYDVKICGSQNMFQHGYVLIVQ